MIGRFIKRLYIRIKNIYEENFAPDGTAEILFAIEEKYQHRFKEFLR